MLSALDRTIIFSGKSIATFPFCAVLAVTLCLNCVQYAKYVPNPEQDIDRWIKNFEQQISFSYEYEMKVSFVHVHASGDCMIGKGEKLTGQWQRNGDVRRFKYVGLGDIEYSREDGAWQESSRGEQSDVFTQIKRILTFDKFQYQGFDDGYWYTFKANIPFLAPDRRKEMIGSIKISRRNYLPELIWAGLPDSSAFWTAQIFGYNDRKNIKQPVREFNDYVVILTGSSKIADSRGLKHRLYLVGVDFRTEIVPHGMLLSLPSHYGLEDVKTMLRPGGLSVYGVTLDNKAAHRIAYLKDNMYAPVYLTDILLTERDVRDVEIDFDERSTPYISLKLHEKHMMPPTVAFEIDSVVVATAALDTSRKMDRIRLYPEMQYHDIEILRAYVAQPLRAVELRRAHGENP